MVVRTPYSYNKTVNVLALLLRVHINDNILHFGYLWRNARPQTLKIG